MEGPNAVLNVMTLPPGATQTQARLVFDGVRGAIFEYQNGPAGSSLIGSWAQSAGTDPYGQSYPQGLNIGVGTITGLTIIGGLIETSATNPSVQLDGARDALFVYDASNNLLFAAAGVGGTDFFGHSYPTGALIGASGILQSGTLSPGTKIDGAGNIIVFNSHGAIVTYVSPSKDGIFFYADTGSATQGALLVSITGLAGVDPVNGTTTLKGTTTYQGLGGSQYGANFNTGGSGGEPGMIVHNFTNPPFTDPSFVAQASGGVPNIADASMSSGQATNIDKAAFITVASQAETGFTNGQVLLAAGDIPIGLGPTLIVDDNNRAANLANPGANPPAPALGSSLFVTSNNTPAWINNDGQVGTIPAVRAVQGGVTNNTTGLNGMVSPPFSIPANDAANGTAYRFTFGGHGTQATGTPVALNFQLFAFGQAWALSADTGGVGAGLNFHWHFDGVLIIGGAGASVAASFFGKMIISQASASAAGHATAMDAQVASGVNTTVATNGVFQAGWASTTGAPTIVCTGATFERLGT